MARMPHTMPQRDQSRRTGRPVLGGKARGDATHPDRAELIRFHERAAHRARNANVAGEPLTPSELTQARQDVANLAEIVGRMGG